MWLRARGRAEAACLLTDFDKFPPIHRRRVVLMQEGQATRKVRRPLGKNRFSGVQEQRQVQERDTNRVQGDCSPCQEDDPAVCGVVAIERVVNPQEASAVIKLLAVEGLEGARGDQREGEE